MAHGFAMDGSYLEGTGLAVLYCVVMRQDVLYNHVQVENMRKVSTSE